MMLNICLHVHIWNPYVFFGGVLEVFCPFLNWVLSYCWVLKFCLYILDISPVLGMWFAHIFYQSVLLSFYFLNSIFCRTSVFNFDEVQFINFLLYELYFWCSKNSLPNTKSQGFSLAFSSKHFIVLHFTFISWSILS